MLCNYGCGQEAKYQLKNGKWCCCKSPNSCSINRKKNSEKHDKEYLKYKKCPYCNKDIVCNVYIRHIGSCEYNPINKKNNIIYNNSKYQKWYNNIIQNRLDNPITEGYKERHHIIPKCCGGDNKNTNIINLTAREHFICHMLLVEIYRNTEYYSKLLHAFMCMKRNQSGKMYINSRLYSIYKEEYAKQQSILMKTNNHRLNKVWISNLELKESKTIDKSELQDYLDKGWIKERIINFDRYIENTKTKALNKIKRENNKNNQTKYYNYIYKIYNENGFKKMVEITGYKYTSAHLAVMLRKYVPEFVPHQGKRRDRNFK